MSEPRVLYGRVAVARPGRWRSSHSDDRAEIVPRAKIWAASRQFPWSRSPNSTSLFRIEFAARSSRARQRVDDPDRVDARAEPAEGIDAARSTVSGIESSRVRSE